MTGSSIYGLYKATKGVVLLQLYHDKPASPGVENALKRAKQMVELSWTPVKKLPSGHIIKAPTGRQYVDAWMPANFPQKGVIYSSPRIHNKFVGSDVSIETYMTALANPESVLYTRPQHGLGRSMFSFYGIVCSYFASYVCQLPCPVACAGWPTIPGVSMPEITRLEELRLCDLLLGEGHIAVITDILRDAEGTVHQICVSESVTPCCRCTAFTPEQFRGYWLEDGYRVCRYAGIHEVTYTPSPYVHLDGDPRLEPPQNNTTFMADYGNKANYKLGECVEFAIFEAGWETVEITGPKKEKILLPVDGSKVFFSPKAAGFYTAVCCKKDVCSQTVDFFVFDLRAIPLKESFHSAETIKITFKNAVQEDKVIGVQVCSPDIFYRRSKLITEEERQCGCIEVENGLEPGEYVAAITADGVYGKYISEYRAFSVE